MKRIYLATAIFVLCSLAIKAQTIQDLFKTSDVKVYWLGVDFSHVKIMGDFGESGPQDIRDDFFPAWNKLIIYEPEKYDVGGMIRKEVIKDLEAIKIINENAPIEEMEISNIPSYNLESLKEFVSKYDFEGKEGIGTLFIAECLNKTDLKGSFYYVVLNMKTKEILLQEKFVGKPKGFGLRNFWAGSIYQIINDIKMERYPVWKAKYSK